MRRIAHLLLAAPALGWSPWRPQDAIKTMAHASAHSFERIVKKAGPPPPPRPPLAPPPPSCGDAVYDRCRGVWVPRADGLCSPPPPAPPRTPFDYLRSAEGALLASAPAPAPGAPPYFLIALLVAALVALALVAWRRRRAKRRGSTTALAARDSNADWGVPSPTQSYNAPAPTEAETVIAAAVREEAGAPGVELANLHDHEPGWS